MLAEAPGIHCLSIPTPFAVGRVNCWLIEDEPLTLVDCGPNSGTALDALERALGDHGRRVEDLERIVVTHQHMDHLGLVGVLARRSGADVCALDRLAPVLERFAEFSEADDTFAVGVMVRNGVPGDVATALREVARIARGWGGSAPVAEPLADGDVLEFAGRRLQVLHRPGHSPSDTVFWDAERGVLFGGDHLLGRVSSNPVVSRPLDGDASERPKALLAYIASMRATREMPIDVVLPGHGDPVRGHAALIDERLALHERRARRISRLIAEAPRTAYAVAQGLWGQVALTQAYLTLSEVLGHVDLLVERGEVVELERDGVATFARA